MAKEKLKAGDKIVFHNCKANKEALTVTTDMTIGKIYTLYENEGLAFRDDAGDERDLSFRFEDGMKVTKIKESK